jgi:predicted small lipoprotein YifL
MRARRGLVIVAIVGSAFTASACGQQGPPPCDQLAAPTANEIGATRDGSEVERELEYESYGSEYTAECVVVVNGETGDWVEQTDDNQS